MAKTILSKELYTLKLTKEDRKNIAKFYMTIPPIFDAIDFITKELKAVEPYIKKWQELEKPISDIIRNIKKEA